MNDMPEKIYLEKHDGELYFSGDGETEYTRSDLCVSVNEYDKLKQHADRMHESLRKMYSKCTAETCDDILASEVSYCLSEYRTLVDLKETE